MIIGKDFIFVQVPRTSSSSASGAISQALGLDELAIPTIHASFLDEPEIDPAGRPVFAFVRNPYEREFSQWKYHSFKTDDIKKPISFPDWVEWRYADKELPAEHFLDADVEDYLRTFSRYPQLGWLMNQAGELMVTHLGYFEEREKYTEQMLAAMNATVDKYPHFEASDTFVPTSQYLDYYTEHTLNLISERYKADIEAFGYTKDKLERSHDLDLDAVTDFSFLGEVPYYLHK